MAIRFSDGEGEDALLAQINTTPLVDVMLVLLIIFLITIPVVNSTIATTMENGSTCAVVTRRPQPANSPPTDSCSKRGSPCRPKLSCPSSANRSSKAPSVAG